MENEILIIDTPEYGPLKGYRAEMRYIDELAKARVEPISFLGVYDVDSVPAMVFRAEGRILFIPR